MEVISSDRLTQYSAALSTLENAASPSPGTVLAVLLARDQVQLMAGELLPADQALRLIQLDGRLRQLAAKITAVAPLDEWRTSLKVDVNAWWWNLEAPPSSWDRFDWLWNALTVTALTASAGLVVDIGSKFLGGGPGLLGSFSLIGQSVLTLATAGGVLTDAGRQGIEQALLSLGIRRPLWQETKLGLSLLLLSGMVGFRTALPQISQYLAESGIEAIEQGSLATAQAELKRAVHLDPDNAEAHYHLGQVYADLGQTEAAQEQYQMAMRGGIDKAYTALAGGYLENGQPEKAAALINQALEKIPDTAETQVLRSHLYTQLGQARLNQERYDEAQSSLEQAIVLNSTASENVPEAVEVPRSASPHCLLAQTLEAQNRPDAAVEQWQQCLQYGNNQNPQEDAWIGTARERLAEVRSNPTVSPSNNPPVDPATPSPWN
jgi:tetratricopeptide (TPR) repeat protein